MTISISPTSVAVDRPYENLLPLVSALLANGNELAVKGDGNVAFYLTQGGWMCDLKRPIDFQLVAREFYLPETITIDEGEQTIFDSGSWIIIRGNVG